ncbi:MAG: protein-disulfide reductase DsbD domain-containing protein, partial [Algoriphagus sp.]
MTRFQKNCLLLLALVLLISPWAQAQLVKPPVWNVRLEGKDLTVGKQATVVLEAQIPMGWYVYSNDFDKSLGPLLTEFVPGSSTDFAVAGKLQAIQPKKKYDEVWKGDVTFFMGKGRFEQPVKLLKTAGKITGSLEYQMCSDLTGQCINYELDIELPFTAKENPAAKEDLQKESVALTEVPLNEVNTNSPSTVGPDSTVKVTTDSAPVASSTTDEFVAAEESASLWGFMVLAFLAGLAALLTPCVFPMIPMTVSFFTGRSKKRSEGIRQAFIYGISIIGIYTVAGTAVAAIQGPEFANWLATHWAPNVFFFGIFVVFALAFLGMFELTLPSSFINKIDAKTAELIKFIDDL